MIFSKKSEIELYKKQQAELVREEKKLFKELQDHELHSKQESRKEQIRRIQALEDQLLVEIESKASRRSRNSSCDMPYSRNASSKSNLTHTDHLDKLKEIQERAKNMLYPLPALKEIPERPPVKQSPSASPLKIPVMIPQSMMRKAQHLPPPTIQRVLRNGDVITVHLVSDKSRINDPLVKAEAQVDEEDLGQMSKQLKGKKINQIIGEIQNQFLDKNRSESMPLKRKYKGRQINLPEAELAEDRQANTPRGKAEYYNFRDLAMDVVSQQTTRTWVSQRMKQYAAKVKKSFVPKTSEKKELEMVLMLEKMKKESKPGCISSRVKLLE